MAKSAAQKHIAVLEQMLINLREEIAKAKADLADAVAASHKQPGVTVEFEEGFSDGYCNMTVTGADGVSFEYELGGYAGSAVRILNLDGQKLRFSGNVVMWDGEGKLVDLVRAAIVTGRPDFTLVF